MIRISKFYIPIFSLFCLISFVVIEPGIYFFAVLGSVFIHEIAHISAMKFCGVKIERITLLPLGLNISAFSLLVPYRKQIFISAMGPFMNFAVFLFYLALGRGEDFFALFNFLYGFLNILPIKGLDGAEILQAFLKCFFGEDIAIAVLKLSSFVFCLLLWMAGVYIFFILNGNISVFALSVFLFASVFIKKQN